MATRACIFCGANGKLTAEDIWPCWMLDRFSARPIYVTGIREQPWRQRGIRLRARVVCGRCNNGWMSRLESDVIPCLSPLVDGRATSLSPLGQQIISAWAVKTLMVMEHGGLTSDRIYFTQDQRELFRSDLNKLPDSTTVKIAAYAGNASARAWIGSNIGMKLISGEPIVEANVVTTATLAVGHLVLQVESSRYEQVIGRGFIRWPTPVESRSEWISPQQRKWVAWPPAQPLNDEELKVFSSRID